MKKALLALASVALLFATSCEKENVNPAVDVPEGSFLATIDNGANPQNAPRVADGIGTMTTIDGSNYVIWDNGDEIKINGVSYTTNTSGNSAVFAPSNPAQQASGTDYHAFYPATIAGTGAAGTLQPSLFYTPGKVSNLPMYAHSTNNQLTFHNICAALKITIPAFLNNDVYSITVSSNQILCGAFNIQNNAAVITETNGFYKSVQIRKHIQGSFELFETGEVVYIPIPANTYTNFTIKFKNSTSTVLWQKTLTTCTLDVNKVYNVNVTPSDIPVNCFHFTALDSTNISMAKSMSSSFPDLSLDYCKYTASDQSYSAWNTFISHSNSAETVSLAAGDKVYFKAASGVVNSGFASQYEYRYFTSTGNVEVSGNIMYLLSQNPSTTFPSGSTLTFERIFGDMETLISAENLELPATTLVNGCYSDLFRNCSSLTAAPALPATTLADNCYEAMFFGCSALVNAPALPATTLPNNCYRYMFYGCSSISEVTMLASNTISGTALQYWLVSAGTGDKKVYIDNDVYDNKTGTSQAIYNAIIASLESGWTIDKVASKPQ